MSAPLLALVLLLGCPITSAQEPAESTDAGLIAALERFIPAAMARSGTPGLNLAVARRGEVVWEKGFGFADLAERTPMTPASVFHSGSMGKTYTATAVMQLVERGELALDDRVTDLLDDIDVENPLGEQPITVQHLLTHRSGLVPNAAGCRFVRPRPLAEHVARGYSGAPFKSYQGALLPRFSAAAGERFQYSNFGMSTLGLVVEQNNADGLSFADFVQRNIMDPLGMSSSQYPPVQDAIHVKPEIFARFSTGYARFGRVYLPTPIIHFADYPAGAVVSTPGDHVKLLLAYLGEGELAGERILEAGTVEQMLTPQEDAFLGLTWWIQGVGSRTFSFSHGGAHMYGWNHFFAAWPELDLAIAVATNQWGMVPGPTAEATEIAAFAAGYLADPSTVEPGDGAATLPAIGVPPPVDPDAGERGFAWRYSYVIGLIMVDRLKGSLGIEDPLTEDMISAMADGALVRLDGDAARAVWDASGFRAGVTDMLSAEMTVDGVREFLASERMRVGAVDLDEIGRAMGAPGAPVFGTIQ